MLKWMMPALTAAGLMVSWPLEAQDDNADSLEALAGELVAMRGEVESLNAELNRLQERHRGEMSSLAAQKGDLEATRRRERLRIEQLEADLERNRRRAEEAGIAGESLRPVIAQAVADLRAQIQASLPFKRRERLDELDELETRVASQSLSPPRAINRLWSFHDDELRLTRENGRHSQVIPLAGERVLADVVRIGTVAMYFRTREGEVGQVERNGDDWRFVTIDDRRAVRQIDALFDSLDKQIRTGYFVLPNAAISLESES